MLFNVHHILRFAEYNISLYHFQFFFLSKLCRHCLRVVHAISSFTYIFFAQYVQYNRNWMYILILVKLYNNLKSKKYLFHSYILMVKVKVQYYLCKNIMPKYLVITGPAVSKFLTLILVFNSK